MQCYKDLVKIRALIIKRQSMQGKLGHTFRELAILMQYLDCRSSLQVGKSDSQRSRFHMEGLRDMTDKKSTIIAWSLRETAWSTAALASLDCQSF